MKDLFVNIFLTSVLVAALSCQDEHINAPLADIEISSPELIEVGVRDSVEKTVYPGNSTITDLVWTSSDPSIAEVTSDGIVTGIGPGVAIITVSTKDRKVSSSDTVHVIRWTHYKMEDVQVRPVAVDRENNVWCGGMELTRIAGNQVTGFPDIKHISAIAVGEAGDKWFGSWHLGVWKFDGTDWTNYNESNSDLGYNSINYNAMTLDHDANLWLGTSEGMFGTGVTMHQGAQWSAFNSDNGLINDAVENIGVDRDGKKWFVTHGAISAFDGSNWVSYTSENTGINLIESVFSMAIDNENNKWFGSYKGALKFDGVNWAVYKISKDRMKWSFINAIAVDKDNNIWFATEYGVAKYDGKKWVNYPSANGDVYNVRAISIDTDGNKWLGTSYGVVKLED